MCVFPTLLYRKQLYFLVISDFIICSLGKKMPSSYILVLPSELCYGSG